MVKPYFAGSALTLTIALTTLLVWVLLDFVQGLHSRGGGRRQDRGTYRLLRVCVIGVCVVALFSTAVSTPLITGQPIPFVTGVVLAWSGIILRGAASRAL